MIFIVYNGGKNMKLNRKTIGILLVVILGCVISIDIYGTYFLTGEEVP